MPFLAATDGDSPAIRFLSGRSGKCRICSFAAMRTLATEGAAGRLIRAIHLLGAARANLDFICIAKITAVIGAFFDHAFYFGHVFTPFYRHSMPCAAQKNPKAMAAVCQTKIRLNQADLFLFENCFPSICRCRQKSGAIHPQPQALCARALLPYWRRYAAWR